MSRACTVLALAFLLARPAFAQDARAVVANAVKAMGVETLDSIWYYGSGANFTLGQNNNANMPWPRVNANDYVRAIDFRQPASRATWVTWAVPVTGGAATQGAGQQNITPGMNTWTQQLEIWVTPWGFLKGAAANGATARAETVGGRRFQVVTWNAPLKSPGGAAYRVVGYIGPENLVERVQTWVEHPFFGDMLVDTEYRHYRDNNGLKFPAAIVQSRAGFPAFEAYVLGAHANPPNIAALLTPPAPGGRAGGPTGGPAAGPAGGRGGPPTATPGRAGGGGQAASAPQSERLADGVYRITGAYNALAVEFADHVLLYEPGPQNDARAQAIIAETKRLFPAKPIRYGVISHHHLDHTGGLPAVVAEGITIVTHEANRAYLERAMTAPRTLAPDALAKSKRKPIIETVGDRRVFQDSTRTVEIHLIKGLPHADGLLVAYLPKERILAYADMFNLPPADNPVPNPPVIGTMVFADNIERLKLTPERILSVHTLNPDRLATVDDILRSLGRK
jgi:glyoxylase-like metal-dependent hydrolase (beta-lactamase superfamily II)